MRPLLPILCLALVLTACEKEAFIRQDAFKTSENLNKNGPPSQSGPYVIRGETLLPDLGIIITDEDAGVTLTLAANNEAFCSGGFDFDVVPFQAVLLPGAEGRIIFSQKGPVRAFVYEGIYMGGPLCDFFASTTVVAEGIVNFHYTDNDLFPSPDSRNRNAFSYKAHGKITGSGGESVILNAHLNVGWDGSDPATFRTQSQIILR